MVAEARCAALFARLAAGDFDAALTDLAVGLAAARVAHDALRAARLRLLGAECARRRGRRGDAAGVVRRLQALTVRLPRILQVRCALVGELIADNRRAADVEVARRHAAAAGLGALTLFVPAEHESARTLHPGLVRGVVGVLAVCQRAEDEAPLLAAVCLELRRQLHAVAAAVFGADGAMLAADGAAIDAAVASRAVAGDLAIDPHRAGDRLEAAAPVRCGAESIGALAVRWSIGTPFDSVVGLRDADAGCRRRRAARRRAPCARRPRGPARRGAHRGQHGDGRCQALD